MRLLMYLAIVAFFRVMLFDVLPRPIFNYVFDRGMPDIVVSCQLRLADVFECVSLSNGSHDFIGQFGTSGVLTTCLKLWRWQSRMSFLLPISVVFRRCSYEKMRRIYASRIIAFVKNAVQRLNTVMQFESYSMGKYTVTFSTSANGYSKKSISVFGFVGCPIPYPTGFRLCNITPKGVLSLLCKFWYRSTIHFGQVSLHLRLIGQVVGILARNLDARPILA